MAKGSLENDCQSHRIFFSNFSPISTNPKRSMPINMRLFVLLLPVSYESVSLLTLLKVKKTQLLLNGMSLGDLSVYRQTNFIYPFSHLKQTRSTIA